MINDPQRLANYTIQGNNHLLNGIFFELYFNKESHLRDRVKSRIILSNILEYHSNPNLQCSFEFINKLLMPFEQRFLQIPSVPMNSVSLDVKMEKEVYKYPYNSEESEYYIVKSIKKDNVELLVDDDQISRFDVKNMDYPIKFFSIDDLRIRLSEIFDFPVKYIKIISNIRNPDLIILLNKGVSL